MKLNLRNIFLLLILTQSAMAFQAGQQTPVPVFVKDVDQCLISLNEQWQFSLHPQKEFWSDADASASAWTEIQVPGEIRMQGFDLKHDQEAAYQTQVFVPADFEDKKIILRFEGVYNTARVWVNGHFVRRHFGGFTPWECDVTEYVRPGQQAVIMLGVTDRKDDISMGSGYAKHVMGGIIRDVSLMALPQNYLSRLMIETDLDANFEHALLNLDLGMHFSDVKKAGIQCRLLSPKGQKVKLKPDEMTLTSKQAQSVLKIPVSHPILWDAEHPNLYTLELTIKAGGKTVQSLVKKIGFREVKRIGNQVFVNGREIKLRGANRHSIHPVYGRTLPAEMEKQDVLLAKEANMNFIRTSHYPPTDAFLGYCDSYGLYVEEETAVTFVNVSHDSTQNSPEFKERYLSQVQEMVMAHYYHPSVITWSIGNESVYGSNFQACYDWIKSVDSNRPVVLSYPATIPDTITCTDYLSVHYPFFDKMTAPLTSLYDPRIGKDAPFIYNNLPILYDEWAHVPAYNIETINRDPNVRNFWGHSLKTMWTTCFNTEGRLGGAIWCMIDDVFVLPAAGDSASVKVSKFGNGEWGIVDAWRRKKPEFWHTRKAYSPVYIRTKKICLEQPAADIELAVQNRFDHTNFNELTLHWKTGATSGSLIPNAVAPHASGIITLPAEFQHDDTLKLEFYLNDGQLIDAFHLPVQMGASPEKAFEPPPAKHAAVPRMIESTQTLTIASETFELIFDRQTGLISDGRFYGKSVIQSGPHLHLTPADLPEWSLISLSYEKSETQAIVTIDGRHGDLVVEYILKIDGQGRIEMAFNLENPPPAPGNGDTWWPRKGFREVGAAFILSGDIDRLTWNRNALWTFYPDAHIGRPRGTAVRYGGSCMNVPGQAPSRPWPEDMRSVYNHDSSDPGFGATHDFRSQKEYITKADVYAAATQTGFTLVSDGSQAVRLEPVSSETGACVRMIINTDWDYPDLGWGCFMKKSVELNENYQKTITLIPFSNSIQ